MRQLAVIAALAGVIRLATAFDSGAAAVLVGSLAVLAAVYGFWANAPASGRDWRLPWGLITAGLTLCVASTVLQTRGHAGAALTGMELATTVAGDMVSIIGLVFVLHRRLAERVPETLSAAAVSVLAMAFPVLSLAVVPRIGWHPGLELGAMVPPALDAVVLWLTLDILSLTDRHPPAYRYLAGGLGCMLVSHATAAGYLLSGRPSVPVPINAMELWGAFLWGCSVLHPSQRHRLDPVPLRSNRPGWPHVVLMVVSGLVTPAVLAVKQFRNLPGHSPILTTASGLLPTLVVAYLLHQVYARSAAEYRAQHDPLTGVCNRVLFNDRLEAALWEARKSNRPLAVMFLDLDRFKSINDSLGHAVGNQLLQAVVKRLQGRLRPEDTLARVGGDEFTILFPDLDGGAAASGLGERILGAFAEPFQVGRKLMPVQTSIGIATYPGDGEDTETLLKNADTAMYRAKAAGRNTFMVYNQAMSARAELRFALETSLRSSLEQDRLTVHFQPKVSASDGRVVGAEALARWKHPKLGFIPPAAFIPLAEETSLIMILGEYVLEYACIQARAWQVSGLPAIPVSVNVSPRQFARQSMVRMVADILARTKLDPGLLELEVTESLLIEHMQDTADCLADLRAMGVRCSIDDFGTGYSGLTYLTEMPVDAIKIDPSFVSRIDSKPETAAIVGAVIGLAHSLGLRVVAEGVETMEQYRFLVDNGCDVLQGYLFSRPLPAAELEALVGRGESLLPAAGALASSRPGELSEGRLESVLARLASGGDWMDGLDRDDVLTIVAALQTDEVMPALAARGIRLVPARMAVGTLAGLASVTGSLGAAGVLPSGGAALASDILHQATGLPVGDEGPPGPVHGAVAAGGVAAPGAGASGSVAALVEPSVGRDAKGGDTGGNPSPAAPPEVTSVAPPESSGMLGSSLPVGPGGPVTSGLPGSGSVPSGGGSGTAVVPDTGGGGTSGSGGGGATSAGTGSGSSGSTTGGHPGGGSGASSGPGKRTDHGNGSGNGLGKDASPGDDGGAGGGHGPAAAQPDAPGRG